MTNIDQQIASFATELNLLNKETDIETFDKRLDSIVGRIEQAGLMEEMDAQLNEAADVLTQLLAKAEKNFIPITNKVTVFTEQALRPIIEEGTRDSDEEQWATGFLAGAAGLLKRNPVMYRSFGPFWWPLKKYLQDCGLNGGEPVEDELFDQVTMGSRSLDIAAAYAYHDWTISNVGTTNTVHIVQSSDGEDVEYQVIDDEFEALIAFGS
ncbi:MAG: hypothetical protein ACXWT1_04680 [Methylobacter sp.]